MIIKKKLNMFIGAIALILAAIPILLVPIILLVFGFWILAILIIFIYYLLNSLALVSVYSNKRTDIQTKANWTFIQIFFPGIGAYFFFIFSRTPKKIKDISKQSELLENDLISKDITNSKVEILMNGMEKFPKLFESLEKAKTYINIQYFIMTPGIIQEKFFSILNRKADEGVKIRILYDYLGNPKWSYSDVEKRRRKNIEIIEFRPINWFKPNGADNWRSHHKTVVIDGKEAFFGGTNIGDEYASLSGYYGDWIDIHYFCIGQIVNSLNAIFFTQWFIQTGDNISNEYVKIENQIEHNYDSIEMIIDSPDRDKALTFEKLKSEVRSAKSTIKIITPYISFPITFKEVIRDAVNRGVKIEIITIGKSDKISAYYQGSFDIGTLNDFGIKIYRMKNIFIHTKMFIFDDKRIIFGTSNLDYRAFFQHYETNIFLSDVDISKWVDYFEKNKPFLVQETERRADWPLSKMIMYFIIRLLKGLF